GRAGPPPVPHLWRRPLLPRGARHRLPRDRREPHRGHARASRPDERRRPRRGRGLAARARPLDDRSVGRARLDATERGWSGGGLVALGLADRRIAASSVAPEPAAAAATPPAAGPVELDAVAVRVVHVERLADAAVGAPSRPTSCSTSRRSARPRSAAVNAAWWPERWRNSNRARRRYVYGCWEMTTSRPNRARPVAAATASHSSFVGRPRNMG